MDASSCGAGRDAAGPSGLLRPLNALPPQRGLRRRRGRPRRTNREADSLVLFIKALEGRKVVVELRNDVIVRGKLDSVDEWMNLTLSSATQQTLQGASSQFEFLYVKGRNIRYVHLPRSLDPIKTIDAYRQRIIDDKIANAKERARQMGQALVKGAGEGPLPPPPPLGEEYAAAAGTDDTPQALLYGAGYLAEGVEGEDLYYSSTSSSDGGGD